MSRRLLLHALALALLSFVSVRSQPVQNGYAVVTCFSDFNPSGLVVGLIDVSQAHLQPVNQNWAAPATHGPGNSWNKANLGEVFGITFDATGDFYVAATSVYGPSPGGPSGPGAVYRIDGPTGSITPFTTTLNAACGSVIGTSTIPNTGSGLGNIAFDATNTQFFVTNFEDGKIYRLDAGGTILSVFDPFSPDGCVAGPVPYGELIWGIGVRGNRVYFARWREDCGNPSGAVANEIWSVALNGSGDFTGTETLELSIPSLPSATHSNPVADISFSTSGKMLFAERTMRGVTTNPFSPNAHAARVLEYTLVGVVWTPASSIFSIGVPGPSSGCGSFPSIGANASGGVDYAYASWDPINRVPVDCDSAIWASGDYLSTVGGLIYGFQRVPAVGGNAANSVLIDADGNLTSGDKTQIGDIEIYKHCPPPTPADPCDQIRVSTKPVQGADGGCCWELTITGVPANTFTSVIADLITDSVTITGVIGPTGWGVTNTGTSATWTPPGGFIPAGTHDSLRLCLFSLVNPPQEIEITFVGANGTVCRDTIRLDCPKQPPPVPPCAVLTEQSVKCVETGPNGSAFALNFSITNNSPFSNAPYNYPAENAMVYSITPGVNIVPGSATFPPVPFGGSTGPLGFTINGPGAVPGAQICFVVQLHGRKLPIDYLWCCPPDTICIRLPECPDCCKDFRKLIDVTQLGQNGAGLTSLGLALTAGPHPIVKATATVTAVYIKRFGSPSKCGVHDWRPMAGEIVSPQPSLGGLPLIPASTPFGAAPPGPYREVAWGTVPAGVPMSGTPLNLGIQLPAPPMPFFGCYDSVRMCVRITWTDTACRTCDTVICIAQRRVGRPIIDHTGPVLSHGSSIPGRAEPATPVEIPVSDIARIEMTDATNGRLIISPDAVPNDLPEARYRIVRIGLRPEAGAEIVSLQGAQLREGAAVRDVNIVSGDVATFNVVYENDADLNPIGNELTLHVVWPESGKDTFVVVQTVNAFIPGTANVTTALVDKMSPVLFRIAVTARTNDVCNPCTVSRIRFRAPDGIYFVAAGPLADSTEVTFGAFAQPVAGAGTVTRLLPLHGEELDPSALRNDSTAIVHLVVMGSDDPAMIEFEALNPDGEVISTGSFEVDPTAAPIGGTPGLSINIMDVFPNPASDRSQVSFMLDHAEQVWLTITDASGRRVATPFEGERFEPGAHSFEVDSRSWPNGTYFYTLRTEHGSQTRKVNITR